MEQTTSQPKGGTWRYIGVAVAPVIVITAFMLFCEPAWRPQASVPQASVPLASVLYRDFAYLCCIAVGVCILLPLRLPMRTLIGGVAVAPLVIMTGFMLFYTPWIKHSPDLDTSIAFLGSIAAGQCFLLALPIRWYYRIAYFFIFLSVAWALLWFYTLFFDFIFLGSKLWKPAG